MARKSRKGRKRPEGRGKRIRPHKTSDDIDEALNGEPEIVSLGSGEPVVSPRRHSTRTFRRGEMRSLSYSGDAPLAEAVCKTATEELGRLHNILDSPNLLGDRVVVDLLEFEYKGNRYPLRDCYTPEYGFVVTQKSVRVVPVPGQKIKIPETIGGLIETNPVTGEPFTPKEQMTLRHIKTQLGKYIQTDNDSAPTPVEEPPQETEEPREHYVVGRDKAITYRGNQSMGYIVRQLAERNFGSDVYRRVGHKIVCGFLEVECNGGTYKVDRRSPNFKLIIRSDGSLWAEPTSPDIDKYVCVGDLFSKHPETGEELSPVEQGRLRIKVRMHSCGMTTTRDIRLGRIPFDAEPYQKSDPGYEGEQNG